jgi:membrane fusion protein (multidrug efflux system)
MFAMVLIAMEQHDNALVIPVDALLTEKTKTSVFKLVDGKAKKTPVKTGFNDGVNVELLEGVGEGDALIVFGKVTLNDGQPVAVKGAP